MKLHEAIQQIGTHSQAALSQVAPPEARLNIEVTSPADALTKAFLWRVSREGYTFWAGVHKQLESGVPIPEPTPEPTPLGTPTEPSVSSLPSHLPPPPDAPEGHHWVYRGTNWRSVDTTHCHYSGGSWSSVYVGVATSGFPDYHYLEAMPDPVSAAPSQDVIHPFRLPDECPPVPPVPDGYSHWEYRGMGWNSLGVPVRYAVWNPRSHIYSGEWQVNGHEGYTSGLEHLHYLEAVKVSVIPATVADPEPAFRRNTGYVEAPFPPVPEGYDRWEDRGYGFDSNGEDVMCAIRFPWQPEFEVWDVVHRATANRECIYLQAVKDAVVPPPTAIPRELLPLPPLPDGFRQWVYRGRSWMSGRLVYYAVRGDHDNAWSDLCPCGPGVATGSNMHYIEAVREPIQCRVGACYVQGDGVLRDPVVLTPLSMSGALHHPYYDGDFYRTAEGRIMKSTEFYRSHPNDYVAETTPQ